MATLEMSEDCSVLGHKYEGIDRERWIMLMQGLPLIPAHMWEGAERYFVQKIEPGSFLMALVCNDFLGAFMKADQTNLINMANWARFLYNHVDIMSRGSEERVKGWLGGRLNNGI